MTITILNSALLIHAFLQQLQYDLKTIAWFLLRLEIVVLHATKVKLFFARWFAQKEKKSKMRANWKLAILAVS